jgi:hypothetical protein
MAAGHPWLPIKAPRLGSKTQVLDLLTQIDNDQNAKNRVFALQTGFHTKISTHLASLLQANAPFQQFNTSPFVLMIFAFKNAYQRISQIEGDILPAKLFSSMETSAGRMVEEVVLPVYQWSVVPSAMHSPDSALDGRYQQGADLRVATLKSGPRCLNDEMAENFADAIIQHGNHWVTSQAGAQQLNFTYGVLYGTERQSNCKDWHILRNLHSKLGAVHFSISPQASWTCSFVLGQVPVTATVRIGADWWEFLGGPTCLLEVCVALIRACVAVGTIDPPGTTYTIGDLAQIVGLPPSHPNYNVGLLQPNQIPWLFLLLKHYYDVLQ